MTPERYLGHVASRVAGVVCRVEGGSSLMPRPMPFGSRLKCPSGTPQVFSAESRDLWTRSLRNIGSPPSRAPRRRRRQLASRKSGRA